MSAPFHQCDFVYQCVADVEVYKAGWYVCMRVETLDGEKKPWRLKAGPCKKESIARSIGLEMVRDLGKPKRLEMRVFKLTKAKPTPSEN